MLKFGVGKKAVVSNGGRGRTVMEMTDLSVEEERRVRALVEAMVRERLLTRATEAGSRRKTETRPERARVSDIFTKTDIHGLPEWYASGGVCERLSWSVIVVLAFTFLIYELVLCAMEFHDNPILTTYAIQSTPEGIPFPHIYICPLFPVHATHKTQSFRLDPSSWEEDRNITQFFQTTALFQDVDGNTILNRKLKFWERVGKKSFGNFRSDPAIAPWTPKDIQDYFMNVGYPIDTLFQECSFETDTLACREVVEEIFDRDYGKCFLIRLQDAGQQRRKQHLPGIGLSLVLDLDSELALKGNQQPPLFTGVVLKIQHAFDIGDYRYKRLFGLSCHPFRPVVVPQPRDIRMERKLLLKPGLNTRVSLEGTKFSLINRERTVRGSQKCRQEGDVELRTLTNLSYSLGLCQMDCVQTEIVSTCNCLLPMDKQFVSVDVLGRLKSEREDVFCSVAEMKSCAVPTIGTTRDLNKRNPNIAKCKYECLVPCDFWRYRTEMSFLDFPSEAAANVYGEMAFQMREKVPPVPLPLEVSRFTLPDLCSFYGDKDVAPSNCVPDKRPTDIPPPPLDQRPLCSDSPSGWKDYEHYCIDGPAPPPVAPPSGGIWGGRALEEIRGAKREKVVRIDVEETPEWVFRRWKKEVVVLDMAFDDMYYREVTQEHSMTFTSFVSNVGGQVGLWVGASIVTLIKFFVILIPICYHKLRHKK